MEIDPILNRTQVSRRTGSLLFDIPAVVDIRGTWFH
jgi:hypothetical protein